jgi:hypothetical protein
MWEAEKLMHDAITRHHDGVDAAFTVTENRSFRNFNKQEDSLWPPAACSP